MIFVVFCNCSKVKRFPDHLKRGIEMYKTICLIEALCGFYINTVYFVGIIITLLARMLINPQMFVRDVRREIQFPRSSKRKKRRDI